MTKAEEIQLEWDKQNLAYETGQAASPSAADRANVVEQILGLGLSDAQLEALADWFYDQDVFAYDNMTAVLERYEALAS